jgi:hyperosmotically inducible protein
MIRALLKAVIVVVLIVGALAFFFGYRFDVWWRGRESRPPAVGTTGTPDRDAVDTSRAREAGAKVGEKVAVAANEAQDAIADGTLTAKIKAKMALDDLVKARTIDVDTGNGVVTVSGHVGSEAERQRALQLARDTRGVRSVVDRLVVR